MKITFVCHKLFDERANLNLAHALGDMGHECRVAGFGLRDPETLSSADVVIEVNKARDDHIPKHVIHIPWVQEYYGGGGDPDYDGQAFDRDLIYTFGHPWIIGAPQFKHWAGSLCMAVEPKLLEIPSVEPDLDFSIAGFIAAPTWFKKQSEIPTTPDPNGYYNLTAELMAMITREIKTTPLSGSFDQAGESARFRSILPNLPSHLFGIVAQNIHETARAFNRCAAAQKVLQVSKNVEFWGLHWDQWPEFAPYAKPFSNDGELLRNLYQRSRINVHDNIFGFAMHSRVLEAMAVGGFVMAHESPHTGAAGQMTGEGFVPGIHYGQYNAANFVELAHCWLGYQDSRQRCIDAAKEVIAGRHLWKHRAQQILHDLGCRQP
jgi:hypothetical protein